MTISATTELDAVNRIIGSIGTAPIASLVGSLGVDAEMARGLLADEVRKLCAYGFSFNTEHEYPLTSDVSGNITLAATILHADLDRKKHPEIDAVKRGTALYNRTDHTYTFEVSTTYYATVKLLLQFDDLPEPAKQYCMYAAGQRFQADTMGDTALYRFDQADTQQAWAILLMDENEAGDYNMIAPGYIGYNPANVLTRR